MGAGELSSTIPLGGGAGEKGGAAVVAQGAIPFASVAAVIKIYFLLSVLCVHARLAARGSRREAGPSGGGGRGRPAGGAGPGRAVGRRRDTMRCCRACRFGNLPPLWPRSPILTLTLPKPPPPPPAPWVARGSRAGFPGFPRAQACPSPAPPQTQPGALGGLCAWASPSSWWAT